MLDPSFWKGRRVLVTGHTGFKGGWLSIWLAQMGASTTGYALDPPTQPSLFEQAGIARDIDSRHGDVRDLDRLESVVDACRPEVVVHMAAQSVVHRGYEDPIETFSTNVMGTVHLLEALRRAGRPCAVVVVTSDKCYQNREWEWGYREIDALGGDDPYSSSKACAELVTAAYRESYFREDGASPSTVAVASVRAGNVIGGGDWTNDQLIPDLIRAFLAGGSCRIRHPEAIRPWQFVLEPLRGYLMLAERLATEGGRFASAWNFGPAQRDAMPVAWIVDEMVGHWGEGAAWGRDPVPHPRETSHLTLDIARSTEGLGWYPVLRLDEAIDWTVEWYRGHRDGQDLRDLTSRQIRRYEDLLRR
jgi:CDP-glucose 4,6-dehydratase